MKAPGVIIRRSAHPVKETIDLLQSFLQQHSATIYARIDQQDELKNAGLTIPPLEFILFGNPKAGGPIMAENPVAALDLPLKVVVWEDGDRKIWVAYNEGSYIKDRFSLSDGVSMALNLDAVVSKAIGGVL
ncbi:MAG TPA: DUF302 domain-containing protein [Mucilaginibacter sp.]|nr:DUF302 domain-containing protein [Mucilaginibacter sp.]